MTIKKI